MKHVHTIHQILLQKICLIYPVPCFDYNFVYTGQTYWHLKLRLAEHKLTIKNQKPEKSAVCELFYAV